MAAPRSKKLNTKLEPRLVLTNGEKKKTIISKSFFKVLLRSHIHLWPVSVSAAVIAINVHGRFIGIDFQSLVRYETINMLLLQVAAKLHEILIVASLGVIVSHITRSQLLSTNGLPLGLISAAQSFNDVRYFLSKDFYGSLTASLQHGQRTKGIVVILTPVLSGVIALLAGPSSASLLLPKDQLWSSAATRYYVDGTSRPWTPFNLSETLPEVEKYCNSSNSIELSICPGAGYLSLLEHWSRMNATNFRDQTSPEYAANLSGTHFYWSVNGRGLNMPSVNTLGDPRLGDYLTAATFLLQPSAAPVTILQKVATDWWSALKHRMGNRIEEVNDRKIVSRMYTPVSYVRCANPQNLTEYETTVNFPAINGRFDFAAAKNVTVPFLNGSSKDKLRLHWFILPTEFGTVSLGAVFESPWTSDNRSRVVLGCSIQSGYVLADVTSDQYTFWTGWYATGVDWGSRIPEFNPSEIPLSPTNGRVAFDYSWLSLLTPPLKASTSVVTEDYVSTIENILESASIHRLPTPQDSRTLTEQWRDLDLDGTGPSPLLEAVIGSVVTDGLSRAGSYNIFNTTGSSSNWPLGMYDPLPDFNDRILSYKDAFKVPQGNPSSYTSLYAKMSISGLNYQQGLATYLAVAVLLVHMLMVVIYLSIVASSQQTSNSWSKISEMIALAQNSRPANRILQNTGGGIGLSHTMGAVVKIRTRPNPLEPGVYDHVELVFEDDDDMGILGYHNRQQDLMTPSALLQNTSASLPETNAAQAPGSCVRAAQEISMLQTPPRQSRTWPFDQHKCYPERRPTYGRMSSDQPLLRQRSQSPPENLPDTETQNRRSSAMSQPSQSSMFDTEAGNNETDTHSGVRRVNQYNDMIQVDKPYS